MLVIDRFHLSLSSPRFPGQPPRVVQREGSQGLAKGQETEEGEQEGGQGRPEEAVQPQGVCVAGPDLFPFTALLGDLLLLCTKS